jgi:hypothetical protein
LYEGQSIRWNEQLLPKKLPLEGRACCGLCASLPADSWSEGEPGRQFRREDCLFRCLQESRCSMRWLRVVR